jgi:hypothetical protein
MKNLWTKLMRLLGFAPKKPTNTYHPAFGWPVPAEHLPETHICSMQQPQANSCAYGGGRPLPITFSQTETFIYHIRMCGLASTNSMKKKGVTRTARIVSELRKKGWDFTTKIEVKGGVKDVIYILNSEAQPLGI